MRKPLLVILLSVFGGVFGDAGDVKRMSVMEGDSVTLNTCVNDIQKDGNIMWTYGPEHVVLANINKGSPTSIKDDALDGRFKGRLIVDPQTGSLSIKNIRANHSGLYTAEITSSTAGTSKRVFNVIVTGVFDPDSDKLESVSVNEGEPVTLNTNVIVKRDDLIVWKFGKPNKPCVYDVIPCDTGVTAIAKLDGKTREPSLDAGEDQMFKDCLSLDKQTGNLTISNTRTQHSGFYLLQINTNTDNRFKRFNVTVSPTTEPSQRTHWDTAGPVFLATSFVLGVIVILLLLKSKKYKSCRNDKDSETTTHESSHVLNSSVTEERI